jgi:hypothetical protein
VLFWNADPDVGELSDGCFLRHFFADINHLADLCSLLCTSHKSIVYRTKKTIDTKVRYSALLYLCIFLERSIHKNVPYSIHIAMILYENNLHF